ncbi:conserved hypothetical protein [Perkinsus marinus ATCC 50983]|uniref:Uncharacterized protein n=1 Tax=Perkinsus marinus (strain ATCC 50983 / TXsc) TaxID=423536 RepID=C5LJQ5_PERM5|nr:conserved hypothetical protein [Perkinsus marinus ATCC 50983]EER03071.1 conserved hypothetical protein [Perkinsus marinus ATCC 50983]|eukprot:XP_002771255.1 conserved hypothetical protein [Perkinsus marinus ATCC 50983]
MVSTPPPPRRRYSSRIIGTVSGREVAPTPAMLSSQSDGSNQSYYVSSQRMPIRTPRRGGEHYSSNRDSMHDRYLSRGTTGLTSTQANYLVAIAVVVISFIGLYVYYTAPVDAVTPTVGPTLTSTIPDYSRRVEKEVVFDKVWQEERKELQDELKRAYDALKAFKEHSAEDRRALAKMEADIVQRDERIQDLAQESTRVEQLERHILGLEEEVRTLQAAAATTQRSMPVDDAHVVVEEENGFYYYVVGVALVVLALVEILSSRADARLQVYSVEANERAKKATTVLKEAMETCRALTEDKEALMEQLEKAIHDKEENASALADSLATLASSRDEFTRFSEEQAKRELALLDRLADSQSAMSSARSMASRALDLKLAPSHDAHQKPPASTLDGKLMSPREEREVDLNGTSTASTCPPSNTTGGTASDTQPMTSFLLPSFTPARKAVQAEEVYDTVVDEESVDSSSTPHRGTRCSDDSSGGVAEAVGDLASPWRASAGIMSTPVTVRYDSYEEEQSWMTPGADSPESVTQLSPGDTMQHHHQQEPEEEEELSPLQMETPVREVDDDAAIAGQHPDGVNLVNVVSNIDALIRSNTAAAEGMSPLDVVSEAPSVNRTAVMANRRRRVSSIDRTTCPLRTPRSNSPTRKSSTPASTPPRANVKIAGHPKSHPRAHVNRLPLDRLSFTTGATTIGYSRRRLVDPPPDSARRGSTGSMSDHRPHEESAHRCVVMAPSSSGGVVTKGGLSRRKEGYATSVTTPTSSVKGSQCSADRPRWRN